MTSQRPFILYDALQDRGATITATSTETGYSTDNLKNRVWDERWRSTGPASVERLTFDLGASVTSTVTAIAISGHNFSESMTNTPTSQLDVEHSTDGTTWTDGFTPSPQPGEHDRTYLATVTGGMATTARRYVRINFRNLTAALDIGAIAIGKRLDFTESMAQGFDPDSLALKFRQFRARGGNFVGGIAEHVKQMGALKFGPAGLSAPDFHNVTGLPSWNDFLRVCWSKGRPFWFAWDILQQPDDMWFCLPPDNAKSSAPFITQTRRGWKFDFDVVAEGYMADAA